MKRWAWSKLRQEFAMDRFSLVTVQKLGELRRLRPVQLATGCWLE